MLSKKVTLNTTLIYAFLGIGLATILFVGLMSGLVARPRNCKQPGVTSPIQSSSTTSGTTRSSSVSSTSSSTTTSPTSRTTTTSSTSRTTTSSSTSRITTSSTTSRTTTKTILQSSSSSTTTTTQSQNRTLPSTTRLSTAEQFTPIRLPLGLVEPISYDLTIRTFFNPYFDPNDANPERFEGNVKINFKLNRNSNYVRLHGGMLLNIVNNTMLLRNIDTNTEYPVTIQRLKNEIVSINSQTQLQSGNYLLTLDFNSNFGFLSSLFGFYRTRYTEDGQTKTILATDFEPTDARKAFPCFDEPALKATFKITIEHPSNSIALSNWPGTQSNIGNNRKRTSFQTTNKMSTYLVAFVVAPDDFGYVERRTSSGIPIRVYGRNSAARNKVLDFANQVAVDVVNYFENQYFQIREALPDKIDLIGIPNFQNGAMENWGLITFRENALFYSEQTNSIVGKQNIALIVAHELAHFWFGNLVTPSWWNDLWLNEAMATFLEYKAISVIFPKWDVLDQFIALNLIPVMYDDGFESSKPVYYEVDDPYEISSLFSSITYDKGASLLFMLESTVGEINFREGLRNYINSNKFGSGSAADFYNTLVLPKEMQAAGVTVQQYMENWLNQINYPHVDIILKNDQSVSVVDFYQERFSLSVFDENFFPPIVSPYGYIWKIYLQCYAGGQGNDPLSGPIDFFNFYLGTRSGSLRLNKKYTWVKCNREFSGFYLSSYTQNNLENLVYALNSNHKAFPIADRVNLLHDIYSLAYKGTENYFDAASLSNYLVNEIDFVPWRVFIHHINKISRIAEHKPSFKDIRYYSFYLINKLKEKIDIRNDQGTDSERLLKANIVEFLCRLQESSCLKYSSERFNSIPVQHFQDPENANFANPVSGNYRRIVYKYHIQNSNNYDDWFKVNRLYLLTNDPFEKRYSVLALGSTRLAWHFDQLLFELLEDNSYIRPQDFYDVLVDIGKNPNGRHKVWAFIREYWYAITYEYGNSRAFNYAIKSICESFDNTFLLEEVLQLFSTTPDGAGLIERFQTIDIIFNNIFWASSRENELQEAFFSGRKSFNQTRFI